MKLCFLMRSEFETVHGGDVVQVNNYIKYLTSKGVCCSVYGRFPLEREDFDAYIIVNIDRPIELFIHYSLIKSKNKPFFIVPIHHPTDAITKFEQEIKLGVGSYFSTIFTSFYTREKLKNFFRVIKGRYWYMPYILKTLFKSYVSITREIIKDSRGLFCISNQEASSISDNFKCEFKYEILINAVESAKELSTNYHSNSRSREYDVVVIGRIERRKNQLTVANALSNSGLKVLFIGALSDGDSSYCSEFLNIVESDENLTFTGPIEQKKVFSLLNQSKLLLNCSFFEVSPLVDVEAAICGCRVVSTKYGYSSGNIENIKLIDPYNQQQILISCKAEIAKFPEPHIINEGVYSWDFAGEKLLNFIEHHIGKE